MLEEFVLGARKGEQRKLRKCSCGRIYILEIP